MLCRLARLWILSMSTAGITPAISRGLRGLGGVLHLGLGGFHRAHQAMVFDALLRAGDARWGVTAVGMRQTVLADGLAARSGRYPVRVADAQGANWYWVGAVHRTLVAARERDEVVRTMADPALRWITLTVTEKGYGSELAVLLVDGLRARCAAGLGGLTIASCDNLRDNGHVLKRLVLEAAAEMPGDRDAVASVERPGADPGLVSWIAATCAFPNSMVDRIVPAPTPAIQEQAHAELGPEADHALVTEGFWEWVIEDRLHDPGDAALLSSVGVTVVDDVRPYEDAKLRLLNGSHSALAFLGVLAGWPTVDAFVADPVARVWLQGLMHEELGPGLQRSDWPAYAQALRVRFANPALGHRTPQIATDGSQKIPQRWVPVIQARLQAGQPVDRLALAAAAWMRLWQGRADDGSPISVSDPMAEHLRALASAVSAEPTDPNHPTHPANPAGASAIVQALGTLPEVWGGELPHNPIWLAAVSSALRRLQAHGVRACLAAFQQSTP
jgi:fructuronate reductase